MLVEADPGRKWKVGTHAYEHPAPALILEIEVELIHPALFELQVRVVVVLPADGHEDPGRLACLEDHGDTIGYTILQIRFDEIIASFFLGSFDHRSAPLLRPVFQPALKLIGNLGQGPAGYPLSGTIDIEESQYQFRLLEGLDQSVQ